ncbi:hypothetical protein DAD99_03755 [Pseudarthrobacter sp. AB1]|nr:hypothetical protein [Pseudarthrobacter sp. AB1]
MAGFMLKNQHGVNWRRCQARLSNLLSIIEHLSQSKPYLLGLVGTGQALYFRDVNDSVFRPT